MTNFGIACTRHVGQHPSGDESDDPGPTQDSKSLEPVGGNRVDSNLKTTLLLGPHKHIHSISRIREPLL
jgi:hypothetical protein